MRFVPDISVPEKGALRAEVAAFVGEMYGDLQPHDLREYLSLICENLLPVLSELETALSRQDLAAAAAQAHRLRNMTAAVGANRLSESLSLLERELRGAEAPKSPFAMEEIRAEGEDLLAILKSL